MLSENVYDTTDSKYLLDRMVDIQSDFAALLPDSKAVSNCNNPYAISRMLNQR